MRRLLLYAIVLGAASAACTPAFDWREVRPEASGVTLELPCKPQYRTRVAELAGEAVTMTMSSCTTQGMTFALVDADLGDPARVTAALIAMRSALAVNLQGRELRAEPFALAGVTPNPQTVRVRYAGRSPDGSPIEEEAAFFTRGTRVYQAAAIGARLDAEAVGVFFDNLRLAS